MGNTSQYIRERNQNITKEKVCKEMYWTNYKKKKSLALIFRELVYQVTWWVLMLRYTRKVKLWLSVPQVTFATPIHVKMVASVCRDWLMIPFPVSVQRASQIPTAPVLWRLVSARFQHLRLHHDCFLHDSQMWLLWAEEPL